MARRSSGSVRKWPGCGSACSSPTRAGRGAAGLERRCARAGRRQARSVAVGGRTVGEGARRHPVDLAPPRPAPSAPTPRPAGRRAGRRPRTPPANARCRLGLQRGSRARRASARAARPRSGPRVQAGDDPSANSEAKRAKVAQVGVEREVGAGVLDLDGDRRDRRPTSARCTCPRLAAAAGASSNSAEPARPAPAELLGEHPAHVARPASAGSGRPGSLARTPRGRARRSPAGTIVSKTLNAWPIFIAPPLSCRGRRRAARRCAPLVAADTSAPAARPRMPAAQACHRPAPPKASGPSASPTWRSAPCGRHAAVTISSGRLTDE